MVIQEYIKEDGTIPFKVWFDSLNTQAAAKVTIALARLEMGNISNIKWFEGIGEFRINWGPGYRIYLAKVGKQVLLLFGGGTKKKQQADIKKAIILYNEYKIRKKGDDV